MQLSRGRQKESVMIDAQSKPHLINRDPKLMSGTPVFMGTRVPVVSLIDWLKGGHTIDEFLDNFPSVTREQAEAVLDLANEFLVTQAR
jgi:uncharacterized protein (DUF433 family)